MIMNKIFILGTGIMGTGIAQVFAQNNFQVTVFNRDIQKCNLLKQKIEKILLEKVKKTEIEVSKIMSNIKTSSNINDAKESDFIIEALIEDMDVKKKCFEELNQVITSKTILATNTSALSITEISTVVKYPENVIGVHFFNPAPVMNLVEIIKSISTSDKTVLKTEEVLKKINKEVITLDEVPGFVVNRILIPMINEAIMLLEQGIAKKEDIDKAMKLGAKHPMGPLELSDLIGNDVVLKIMETLYAETGDSKYRTSYLLKKYVLAKKLGRKTKEGFYKY